MVWNRFFLHVSPFYVRTRLWIISVSVTSVCVLLSAHITSCHIIHPLRQGGFVTGHLSFLESVRVWRCLTCIFLSAGCPHTLIYSFSSLTPLCLHLVLSHWCLPLANWFISIPMTLCAWPFSVYFLSLNSRVWLYVCVCVTDSRFSATSRHPVYCSDAHSAGSFGFQPSLGTHRAAPINWFEKGCGSCCCFVNKYSTMLHIYYTRFDPLVHVAEQ